MMHGLSPTGLITLAVAAESLSLVLYGRANTLWRVPGMAAYPRRFLLVRSTLALFWVHLVAAFFAPGGFIGSYPPMAQMTLLVMGLGAYGGLGLLFFSMSVRSMPAQLVFFGGSLHLVVATVLGRFIGELISPLRFGIIAAMLAIQLGLLWRDQSAWQLIPRGQRLLPFAVGVIWGTYFPLFGLVIKNFGFWPTLIAAEWGVVLLMLAWFSLKPIGTWADSRMWRSMLEQSILSSLGQALSGLALWWGGLILHSILTNFNGVVNVSAFNIRYGEPFSIKYILYFAAYIVLATSLIIGW